MVDFQRGERWHFLWLEGINAIYWEWLCWPIRQMMPWKTHISHLRRGTLGWVQTCLKKTDTITEITRWHGSGRVEGTATSRQIHGWKKVSTAQIICACHSKSIIPYRPFYRVNWLRAKAWYDRWQEEVALVNHEMMWTINWFEHQKEKWTAIANDGDQHGQEGHIIYAQKQILMWAAFADKARRGFENGDSPRVKRRTRKLRSALQCKVLCVLLCSKYAWYWVAGVNNKCHYIII